LDLIGCVDSIYQAAFHIDAGRKGWAIRGKEQEGRISYEKGISEALSNFEKVQTSADPQTLVLAEYTFISQELELCRETEKTTLSSLTLAKQSFDDAFLALEVVKDKTLYQGVDRVFPHRDKYRVNGFPKDAFHIACMAHKTRLKNIERSPGIDPIEKALLRQRLANMTTAQSGYINKQKSVLA
jgi:hypothetical protein